jgi:hypothetical protein
VNNLKITTHLLNNPNQEAIEFASRLAEGFASISEILSDNQTKQIISNILPSANSTQYKNIEVRMDYIIGNVGIVSCMGTSAIISRRILASLHYHFQEMVDSVILVAQSYENTVIQANKNKIKPQNGNGNRASATALLETISDLRSTFCCPVIILELTQS